MIKWINFEDSYIQKEFQVMEIAKIEMAGMVMEVETSANGQAMKTTERQRTFRKVEKPWNEINLGQHHD